MGMPGLGKGRTSAFNVVCEMNSYIGIYICFHDLPSSG